MITEEFYIQKLGKNRIICVKSWNHNAAIVEDLATSLVYAINWDLFFRYCVKMKPVEIDVENYNGSDLDKLK